MKLFTKRVIIAFGIYCQQALIKAQSFNLSVSAPGATITEFSGSMLVPTLENAGGYYLSTGLGDFSQESILESLLDGSSGDWSLNLQWLYQGISIAGASGPVITGGQWLDFNIFYESGEDDWVLSITGPAIQLPTYSHLTPSKFVLIFVSRLLLHSR